MSRIVAPWIVFFAVFPVHVSMVFVVGDFLSYWQHRLFHTGAVWPIHAVHHSSENLDWLSATRFHPLNEIGAQLIYVAPLIAVGLSPMVFVVLASFTVTYAVFLHANINLSHGPLRQVLASATFHRWHHTQAAEAQSKNFAGFLPLWDVIFGTFYHPQDEVPIVFGVDEPVPTGFARQLLYPLSARRKTDKAATSTQRF